MSIDARQKWIEASGKAPEDWHFYSIEELLATPKSIAVGVMYPGPNTSGGVPLIKVADVKGGRVNEVPSFCISADKDNEYKRTRLSGDELLITLVGNPGDCVLATPGMSGWNVARAIAVVRLSDPELREWVRYSLLSRPAQNFLSSRFNTTVQKTLNLKDVRELSIPVPDPSTRKAITSCLRSLDDKIELNRQINATLESMAQALFKSWFVDFDPVIDNALAAGNDIPDALQAKAAKRKALGDKRKPLPDDLQQQFPDRFVFTEEMAWVPEGWGVSTIGESVEATGGGTPSTKESVFWDGGVHAFCTPKDMSQLGSLVLTDTERHLTDAGIAKVSSGLLPPGTVLMSSRAPIGYLAISNIPVSVNQGVIALLPSELYSPMYLLCWAQSNMDKVKDRANGSTFLEISKKNFRPIPFLTPGSAALSEFNRQATSLYSRILVTSEHINQLTKLRDTLLPKLLSGELRIPDAEKQIAEVV